MRATPKKASFVVIFELLLLASPAGGQTLLSDDFDDGDMQGWTVVDEGTFSAPSAWQVIGGELVEPSDIFEPSFRLNQDRRATFAYWDDPAALAWSDYQLSLTLRSTDDDGIGVLFRYQDPGNYYRFEMDRERNFMKLFLVEDGYESTLAAVFQGYPTGLEMSLVIAVHQDRIRVVLDGEYPFLGEIQDAAHSTGTVALYDWANRDSFFDDVLVQTYSPGPDLEPPAVPTGVVTKAVSGTRIDLSWTPSSDDVGVDEYVVLRDGMEVGRSGVHVFSDTSVQPSAVHAYEVRANDAAGNLSASSFPANAQALGPGEFAPFTVVALPDTQVYSRLVPDYLTGQTLWVRDRRVAENVAFVVHEGDIVGTNQPYEWDNASFSYGFLREVVPFALLPGNHDMGLNGWANERDTTLFNAAFPSADAETQPTFGGLYESGKLDNSYHIFRAGGLDWLVLMLEFGPRDPVLAWASQVIADRPYHNVIVVSHTHVYPDDTLHGSSPDHLWNPHGYGVANDPDGVNDGVEVWDELLRWHRNVKLVLNGHCLADGAGRLTGIGNHGNAVYQMLANYQNVGIGGDGYLRLIQIDVPEKRISVQSYSPLLDQYLTDPDHQFQYDDVHFVRRPGPVRRAQRGSMTGF